MYINPNSTIKILRNVPLDNTYEHTIYFESSSAQSSFFTGKAKYTFEAQSYQRVKRGYIRVATNAENLYDCNYLMFQNSAFGSKWFYAFIKSVEYINNGVSEIEFEIDVMQTWHFNYNLQECFVEREHSATDEIGENIVDEKVALGDYVTSHTQTFENVTGHYYATIACTFDENLEDNYGYGYLFTARPLVSGLKLLSYDISTENGMTYFFNKLKAIREKNLTGGICAIYYSNTTTYYTNNYTLTGITNSSFNGYVPTNKKLYTYPYNFLYITNLNGTTATYRYEFFQNQTPIFKYATDNLPNNMPTFIPLNYKGVIENTDEAIVGKALPMISNNEDCYTQWLAQSGAQIGGKILNAGTSTLTGAATGAIAGGGAGALIGAGVGLVGGILSAITSTVADGLNMSVQPNQCVQSPQSLSTFLAGMSGFKVMNKSITGQYAKIIDDYFTKFGYATKRVKKPNRQITRFNWCYTKTIGCTITGSVPCDDMKKICSVYDKGITFWKNGSAIGQYH